MSKIMNIVNNPKHHFIHANDHFVQSGRNDLVVSDNLATFASKFSE